MLHNSYVDLHCHPGIKPYGKSFSKNPGSNSPRRSDKNSIWFYDSPNFFEKAVQLFLGVSKFTQADCTTLAHGNVRVVCASLYPIERGFFNNELGTGVLSDLAAAFATGVGDKRVDFIQKNVNYFDDLVREYSFYQQGANAETTTNSGQFKYVLATDFATVDRYMEEGSNTIVIVLTIEGMHVVHSDIDHPSESVALQNVKAIKQWTHAPFFVTMAHHFNNHLCGHARSLFDLIGDKTNQTENLDAPFSNLGRKVVHELLSTKDGKRIYIDIKHMSVKARREYIDMITGPAGEWSGEDIPIIISHGAANGLKSATQQAVELMDTGNSMMKADINFYDDELVAMARSNGIIGLQLDERRIASKEAIKRLKQSAWISKVRHYRASLLWNQIQHIAELLDKNNLFAWDCLAIGSDYDGIIDPLNGFLTQETIVHLEEYVERYAYNYMNGRALHALRPFNRIPPDEIVQRIFHANSMTFMRKYYRS